MDFSPRADLLWCSDESESAQVLYHLSASFISSLQEHDLWQSLVSPQIHSSKLEYDLANFIYNLHSPNPLLTPPTCTDSSMVYHRAGKLTVAIGDQSKLLDYAKDQSTFTSQRFFCPECEYDVSPFCLT